MSKVSVIIPIYNVEEYLPKCLDSVINQTYKDLEILCVNDCSPDNCDKILEDYAARDARIKIITRAQNGGLSTARNTGLEAATGEYIYFIDSDDWIDEDYIERMVIAIEKTSSTMVLNTAITKEFADKSIIQNYEDYKTINSVGEFVNSEESVTYNPWMTWAYLYRKSYLDNFKLKFPDGYNWEDIYFQYITHAHCETFYVIKGSYYHYRQRENSIIKLEPNSELKIIEIYNLIYEYLEKNNLLSVKKFKLFLSTNLCKRAITETKYNIFKEYFNKIKGLMLEKKYLYSSFEIFFAKQFIETSSYEEYCKKYNMQPRLLELRKTILDNQDKKNKEKHSSSIPIFLAADNNYAPFVATTIASICDNTKSFCNFYILDSGITNENKKKIEALKTQFNNFEIEYLEIDTDKYFPNFRSCVEHLSISTYNRFLIHKFKPELKKCIYLDVDTITLIDIQDLYNVDMEGHPIAARPALWLQQEELRHKFHLRNNYMYFNAGVLLLDNTLWHRDNILEKLLDIEAQYREILGDADQGVLNIYCNKYNACKYIDAIYNTPPIHINYKDKAILHFLNDDKPWYFTPDFGEFEYIPATRRINEFWHYAKLTPFYDDILKRIKYSPENDMLKLRVKSIVFKENKKLREALALSQK